MCGFRRCRGGVDSIRRAFAGLHFQFVEQFLVALLPMALTVVIHGQAMHWVALYSRRYIGHRAEGSARHRAESCRS